MKIVEMTPEEGREFFCKQAAHYRKCGDTENMNLMLDKLNELDTAVRFVSQVQDHG